MITRIHEYVLVSFLIVTGTTAIFFTHGIKGQDEPQDGSFKQLTLEVKSDKETYVPGQLVSLTFKTLNKSDSPLVLNGNASVWNGRMKVVISYAGREYLEYRGPGWGLHETFVAKRKTLQPREFAESEATILYNNVTRTSHLSEEHARQIAGHKIKSEYVFAEPGVYSVKAIMFDSSFTEQIESAPIQIVINAPFGADLEVWNEIKKNGNYGYFIQAGSSRHNVDDVRTTAMLSTLEELVAQHPDSEHSQSIKNSLSKFRSTVEKLRSAKKEKH